MPETEALIKGLSALAEGNNTPEVIQEPAETSVEAIGAIQAEASIQTEAVLTQTDEIPTVVPSPTQETQNLVEQRSGQDRRSGADRRAGGESASLTLRVESERIDTAMNLVGELIIQRSMIATLTAEIEAAREGDENSRLLTEAVAVSGRILSELQESVMRMRLVAIDQVFRRFPRVVRDASVKLGKPLRMEVEGGQTEIDKSIVEVISDPLIHLVRNSCDHGVEMPETRIAAGKPAEGVIKLAALRAEIKSRLKLKMTAPELTPRASLLKQSRNG